MVLNRRSFVLGVAPAVALAGSDLRLRLDSLNGLEVIGRTPHSRFEVAPLHGRRAVRIVQVLEADENGTQVGDAMAILTKPDFGDGTIEVDVAGSPREGAPPDARGFVGIAFRVEPHGSAFECFYIRPTNGRAADQLLRNHSVQYVSAPDYSWKRLRTENPGVYESYADMEPGVWTKLKIEVAGVKAKLYVNGARQPCLIVNDLKRGQSRGQIALFAGTDAECHFANLAVRD